MNKVSSGSKQTKETVMKRVLFGGVFDLMHAGHVLAIKKAKSIGDYLIVNVVSDERTRAKKGPTRPILPAKDRVAIISELRDVDEVICLYGDPEYGVIKLLDIVKPDILIMDKNEHGTSLEQIECDKRGIELVYMDRVITDSELDTSGIMQKIIDSSK